MRKASFFLLSFLLACSGGTMDKATAANEIRSYLKGEHSFIFVDIGRVGSHCILVDSRGQQQNTDLNPDYNVSTVVARKAGYLTVAPDGKGFWRVELTDKGKAAAAATQEESIVYPPLKGCDYQQVDFFLASPELEFVSGVTADENNPEVDYFWKWNVTELGQTLRRDGQVYPTLTPLQQAELQTHIHALVHFLQLPVPPESFTSHSTVKFKKYTDGWRVQ